MHRILIAIDLILVLLLWRAALDASQDVNWCTAFQLHPALFMAFGLALISWVAVSFPGETHANWTRFGNRIPPECNLPWFGPLDRLSLSRENFVDKEQLAKIEARVNQRDPQKAYLGERTRSFQSRNLSCGEFESVDLRRADFASATMRGVVFSDMELQGASMDYADLTGAQFRGFENRLRETSLVGAKLEAANLFLAQLPGAHLAMAQLRGANLRGAQLQGVRLTGAQLQGADLSKAMLLGADLRAARLQGAVLTGAQLQGADLGLLSSLTRYEWPISLSTRFAILSYQLGRHLGGLRPLPTIEGNHEYSQRKRETEASHLQGADLTRAVLRGAVLTGARLEGANLIEAELQDADLSEAQLQGAQLDDGLLELTLLRQAHVWRATGAQCNNAQVMESQIAVPSAAVQIERFIDEVGREVPEPAKQRLQARLRERLITDTIDDQANERVWRDCESKALNRD